MTEQKFAAQIKQKYPVYKNIDDATLVKSVIEKYPVYKNQITDLGTLDVIKQGPTAQAFLDKSTASQLLSKETLKEIPKEAYKTIVGGAEKFIKSAVEAPMNIVQGLQGKPLATTEGKDPITGEPITSIQSDFQNKTIPAVESGEISPLKATAKTVGETVLGAADVLGAEQLAKGAVEGAIKGGKAIAGATKRTAENIQKGVTQQVGKVFKTPSAVEVSIDAVNPELTGTKLKQAYQEVLSGKRTVTPGTVFSEQTLSPDEQTMNLGIRLKDVVKSKDPLKNLDSLNKELTSTEARIQTAFDTGEVIYNADKSTLFSNLENIKTTTPREFAAIKESKAVFDNVVDYGEELLQAADDTPLGIRNARIAFDAQVRREYPNAFKEGAVDLKTPAGRAIKAVRDSFNEHLYNTAPNGSAIKELIGHEADLYRANENIAAKAAKMNGENRLIQWMKKNPGKVKALSLIGGAGGLIGVGAAVASAASE